MNNYNKFRLSKLGIIIPLILGSVSFNSYADRLLNTGYGFYNSNNTTDLDLSGGSLIDNYDATELQYGPYIGGGAAAYFRSGANLLESAGDVISLQNNQVVNDTKYHGEVRGGAFYSNENLTIGDKNSHRLILFSHNHADSRFLAYGGGVYVKSNKDATLTFNNDVTFLSNSVNYKTGETWIGKQARGGAIYIKSDNGKSLINFNGDALFMQNTAADNLGGAIYIEGSGNINFNLPNDNSSANFDSKSDSVTATGSLGININGKGNLVTNAKFESTANHQLV